MLDLFGREVKRGDIIVIGVSRTIGFNTYTRTRLGVVSNILPNRKWPKSSWQYKRILGRHNARTGGKMGAVFGSPPNTGKNNSVSTTNVVPLASDPDYFEVCEKITFHPFDLTFTGFSNKFSKNGTPIVRPQLSNTFIIIDEDTLSQEWKDAYHRVKQAFKI